MVVGCMGIFLEVKYAMLRRKVHMSCEACHQVEQRVESSKEFQLFYRQDNQGDPRFFLLNLKAQKVLH